VYIGGAKGAPGAEFHNIGLANLNRPDIGAANPGSGNFHGFSTDIITCKGGTQTVYVYAVNIDSNGNVRGDSVLIGSKTVNLPLIIQLVDRRIITLPYWRYIHIHYAQQVLKIKKPFPWPDPPPVYRLEPSTLYKFEAIIITDKNARPFFAFEIDDGFELYPVDTEIEKALTESGVKFSPNEKYLQMATVETDINGDMILSIENELKFQEQVSSKSQRFITIEREMNFKEQIANKFQK